MTVTDEGTPTIAPGSVVLVRDEEWLVTQVEPTNDGSFIHVQGLSELVRETEAVFATGIAQESIEILDPANARVVADDSPEYRRARLWLEATMRRSSVPLTEPALTVSTEGLADTLDYQLAAVRKALDPEKIRPRILLADAVGLGKTLEIGMILSELARRGRGERILIVTPKHVLEQMQYEMWTRFALPFVRLDSVGIQRIRQKLPANRNPFAFYKRVIVSIDTLKSDRYLAHLEKQQWDAVVIDESHNVTNSSAQNNRLARLLARKCDALILASATPHNGKAESFAELVRMLEPSAVTPDGELVEDEVARLVIRRHRHSPEVANVVGDMWAERMEPRNVLVPASPIENEIAVELDEVWLHPKSGSNPYSGKNAKLFPWTLAKAFLSSPAALKATVRDRIARLGEPTRDTAREIEALQRLADLADRADVEPSSKYEELVRHLKEIGVGRGKTTRAVVFAERVATLEWLQRRLTTDLRMKADEVVVLHGGLSDESQQEVVESFKQESSAIRVLVTGDVASEGVNLHLQCHHLIHFDIPWSLIRIEQRNGRIDRYGQRHRPQITTLLLDPDSENFAGDVRILKKLMEKEHEAHRALGDAASLMGKYSEAAEEETIRQVLARERDLDDEVRSIDEIGAGDGIEDLFARLLSAQSAQTASAPPAEERRSTIYPDASSYLADALDEVFQTPGHDAPNGVSWKQHPEHGLAELRPPRDLAARLQVLPQSYLRDRKVVERFVVATTQSKGRAVLADAMSDDSSSLWPEASYLAPLHPVLDWISDRALGSLGRNEIFAVRGHVDHPSVLVHGSLTNRRGQVVAASFVIVEFPDPGHPTFATATPLASMSDALDRLRIATVNTGAVSDAEALTDLVRPAVHSAESAIGQMADAAAEETRSRVKAWSARLQTWQAQAETLFQRDTLRRRREDVTIERRMIEEMLPEQRLIRPLLVVVGEDH
ncbi:DEAD/DEAH box helicase [Aeromicrobium senzhongii]|uniref:DEAD/DEAH box helicase n=1 Tax=Aeromicrobium senzhongii TaxID=2663859 RepID=A0ABX6SR03_9ACTN|nr:helicase-related protein [Aeromicrobium senzhongii]MTB89047.1 DEAD/DEAH box helicase [Aeromicrobium senzhongii]QNL93682.1 DEAD/DEAH box helicase [Aeromicrobium senzhongii]